MVLAWFPQGRNRNIVTNSNYPPQNYLGGGGVSPVLGLQMIYNVTGEGMLFNVTGEDMNYNVDPVGGWVLLEVFIASYLLVLACCS